MRSPGTKTINIIIIIIHGDNGDGDRSELCWATCQAIETCQAMCWSTTLFTCTSLAPTTAIQIKELDYCHHPQIDVCCLGFLNLSNWILIPSSFIIKDICRVSLVVLLLRSAIRSFLLSHTPSYTQIQNVFWYCGRFNLIHLYFTINKHTVWHGGCHMFY